MPDETDSIEFKETLRPTRGAEAIRLTRRNDAVVLVASWTAATPAAGPSVNFSALLPANPSARWSSMMDVGLVVPARPLWDVAVDSHQRLEFAYDLAGGAINDLLLRTPTGEARSLGRDYPGESFSTPRFSRPAGEPPGWVTAVVADTTCVAFRLRGGPYRSLSEATDCLLIRSAPGFLLITKTRVPGRARGNDISPGQLHVQLLDDELHQAGDSMDLIGGPMFEFDADLILGTVVIAATTEKGVALASAIGPTKFTVKEYALPMVLTSPALVATGPPEEGKGLLGALDTAGKDGTRILLAEIPARNPR